MFTLTLNIYLLIRYIRYRYDINKFNQIYIINLLIGFILGPDRNSGSGPLRYPFRWNLGWYQTGTVIFYVVFRFYDELPASRAPSSSLAGSRAPLQFPD